MSEIIIFSQVWGDEGQKDKPENRTSKLMKDNDYDIFLEELFTRINKIMSQKKKKKIICTFYNCTNYCAD